MMQLTIQNKKGFTIVEMLIVIVVLGTIAAVASSNWNKYTVNANLRSAARDVASDFFVTREKAVSENANYRVTFDVGANNYVITNLVTGVLQTKTPTSFGADIVLQSVNFGGSVDFQTRGTVSNGNLVLRNSRGSTATITVNITGRTYVQFAML